MSTGRTTNRRKRAEQEAAAVSAAAPPGYYAGVGAGATAGRVVVTSSTPAGPFPAWSEPGPGLWDSEAGVVRCCGRTYSTERGYLGHLDREHPASAHTLEG